MVDVFKAFVFSDPHLGNRLPHSTSGADGVTDRLVDQLEALVWCFDQADRLSVPLVCLGDLFDDHAVDTITLELVAEELSQHNRPLYVVPGNHDAHDQTHRHFSPTALSHLTSGVRVLNSLSEEAINLPGGELVAALPFCSPAAARKFFEVGASKNKLLLGHLEVDGFGHGGAWMCTNGLTEEDLLGWGAVLSGHFHAQQQFKKLPGGYVGALAQLKFDDARKDQGGMLVSWDGYELKTEFVSYEGAPTFGVFQTTAQALADVVAGHGEVGEDDGDGKVLMAVRTFTKFVVSGTDDQLRSLPWTAVREIAKSNGARKVVFEHRPVAGNEKHRLNVDINEAPLEDLIKAYVEHPSVKKVGLDQGVLLDLGLSFLSKAMDLRKRVPAVIDKG